MSEKQKENMEVKAGERIYKLSRPFVYEEKTYTELVLDFGKLSGEDTLLAEKRFVAEYGKAGESTWVKELSKGFQAYIVAAAAGVPVEMVKKLPIKDFSEVTLQAQNFLLL